MKLLKKAGLALGLAVAVAAAPAHAVTITPDTGWQSFDFFNDGGPFDPASFDFTLTTSATFKITDAYIDGDQFQIFINGVSAGLTSTPTDNGVTIGTDYDAAFASSDFSHAAYTLGPGTYTITGLVAAAATGYDSGAGAVELVSAAPEPSTWALMLLGFGMVGHAIRKRRGVRVLAAA